ncbi:non-specific serine/threonine protein kinase [Malassezia brasiliensis]|uniref:Serine/threonine-protein kinase RIO2 n=1 Tax=Malassezia brasiliensis TaxID=1821822 RepID=A0AAF0IM24_9BASI|nr:non-specific serine/threonine protein kinase [Malassezia brasiliensis]
MRLDATDVRYITPEEFRVLTAVEMGSKNHEIVPSTLIAQISALQHAGISKLLASLAKRKLVARVQNNAYDGFRLTYGGYDYLAVRALSKRKSIYSVGQRIGVGKESDIQIVANEEGETRVLKLHRLGRISFRKIKEKRDYMGNRKSASWMYMSRLAAEKEFEFMKVLYEHQFPVPLPIDQARHTLVMSYIDAYPLRQISGMPFDQVAKLYAALMALIVRLAKAGLIHGDFNEFNLLIREVQEESEYEHEDPETQALAEEEPEEPINNATDTPGVTVEQGKGFERVVLAEGHDAPEEASESEGEEDDDDEMITFEDGVHVEPILIDFPQMVSIEHPNAEYYFTRDVDCVRRFFKKRFRFEPEEYPTFDDVIKELGNDEPRLDAITKASGYQKGADELSSVRAGLTQHLESVRLSAGVESSGSYDDDTSETPTSSEAESSGGESDDEREDSDEVRPRSKAHGAPTRPVLDASKVAARVAASQSQAARQAKKHHGQKSQASKPGRRHGGGKGKYNQRRVVADNVTF